MGVNLPVADHEESAVAAYRDQCDTWPIRLPDLGASSHPVQLSAWLVRTGDEVSRSDRLVEVLIRGVTFDLHAECSGRMGDMRVFAGAELQVGDVLGWLCLDEAAC